MRTVKMQVGPLGTNCYIAYDEKAHQAVVLDPGGSAADILSFIDREHLDVLYILNTHGHADHIAANDAVKRATKAIIAIHEDDAAMLQNAQKNLSMFIGGSAQFPPADQILKDGDIVKAGTMSFEVLHTPGHTPGGVCFLTDEILFSGDTLFCESIGRTDFPGGSYEQLIHSIKEKLMPLKDEVKVFPGHGPDTTIGWERKMNPFIK
jgi:hydroxyacylglutathione hydrolase